MDSFLWSQEDDDNPISACLDEMKDDDDEGLFKLPPR